MQERMDVVATPAGGEAAEGARKEARLSPAAPAAPRNFRRPTIRVYRISASSLLADHNPAPAAQGANEELLHSEYRRLP